MAFLTEETLNEYFEVQIEEKPGVEKISYSLISDALEFDPLIIFILLLLIHF